jgi:hypothetical protein
MKSLASTDGDKRVLWFKKPEDAPQETKLFLAHVMTYRTLGDISTILH